MNALRKLLTCLAAAVVLAAGTVVANASVYDTPGGHIQSSRLWDTDCEMYSSNVVRCETSIWATQVVHRDGAYTRVTGWTFNNLSYLPSPRATWAGNNLGRNAPAWDSGGRTWRTECDTPATGRGACRSYIWTSKPTATWDGRQWVFANEQKWVFNNLVLFSGSGVERVTEVPAHLLDQSVLAADGFGPLRIGTRTSDLEKLGYLEWRSTDVCEYWQVDPELSDRGLFMTYDENETVLEVILTRSGPETDEGAQVSMTLEEVRAVYGAGAVKLQLKQGYDPVHVAVVRDGANEIIFLSSFELNRPMVNSDPISMIIARKATSWLGWDGC